MKGDSACPSNEGRAWGGHRESTAEAHAGRSVPPQSTSQGRARLQALPVPGEAMASSPHPQKVGAEVTPAGRWPLPDVPIHPPGPQKVTRRNGCSPFTTGQVFRKSCSDASSLLPQKLSQTLHLREEKVTHYTSMSPVTPSGEAVLKSIGKAGSARAPSQDAGGNTAVTKCWRDQVMNGS